MGGVMQVLKVDGVDLLKEKLAKIIFEDGDPLKSSAFWWEGGGIRQ